MVVGSCSSRHLEAAGQGVVVVAAGGEDAVGVADACPCGVSCD